MRKCISGVTRVPRYLYGVVGCLTGYYEPTVLSIIPATKVTILQVKPQLVAAVNCQLMQLVITEPVVAISVVESDFELRPRTEKGVASVDVSLDQQRLAVG